MRAGRGLWAPVWLLAVGSRVVLATVPARIDRTADMAQGRLRLADRRLSPGTELARFLDHLGDDPSSLREWMALPLWDVCDGGVVLLPGWIGLFLVVPPLGGGLAGGQRRDGQPERLNHPRRCVVRRKRRIVNHPVSPSITYAKPQSRPTPINRQSPGTVTEYRGTPSSRYTT